VEKYRGYLLDSWESTHEIREWSGGHSSEGTGRYETNYGYKIIDPKSGKYVIVWDGLVQAKKEVDKLVDPVLKKEAKLAATKIKRAEAKIAKLEAELKSKERAILMKIREARQSASSLKEELKPVLQVSF